MKTNKLAAVDNWRALAEQAGFKPAVLAKLVGVSLATLERFFHGQIGRSPENWLNELRLRVAAQRLAAGGTISDVLRDLGFYDRSQFHHQFRQLLHQTPGEFVADWNRREVEWIAQGGSASASPPPSRELEEAVRAMEAQLRGDAGHGPEPAGQPVRIALVDDDPNAQRAMQEAFALLAPDWRLESHSPSKEAVQRLVQEPPAAVLVGGRRPKNSRVDYIDLLATSLVSVPIILFAASSDGGEMVSALAAGAVGCVLKTAPPDDLVHSVQDALQEGIALSRQAQHAVVKFLHGLFRRGRQAELSSRQRELLVLLLNQEKRIAEKLHLSKKTVAALLERGREKLRQRAPSGTAWPRWPS